MEGFPTISIITVNYKQALVTNQLLDSLQGLTWPNYEVIIVDNASGIEDINLLNLNYPNVTLIKSSENLGFAGGNNLGIRQCKGDYILLLNNDTEVDAGFLEPMVSLFIDNPKIGAVSPKIKYFYQPDTIQYAGFTDMNPFTMRMNAIGSKQKDNGDFDYVEKTHFAHGCAMMVSRNVIDIVGLMPDIYFLYYEEHDWSMAIKRAGFEIFYQPASIVFHKESISTGKDSPLKTYYINRSRLIFTRRNYSGMQLLISILFQHIFSFPKNTLNYLLHAKFKHLKAYWKAYKWNITHFSGLKTNPTF